MNKKTILELLALVLIIGLIITKAIQPKPEHVCTDYTHLTCDGNCYCDGMECTKIQ